MKIASTEAWDILVKPDREKLLEDYGKIGLDRLRNYFLMRTYDQVEIDAESTKEVYQNAINSGAYGD